MRGLILERPFQNGPAMARPREFDESEVLEAAVQCFWSRGYEATSVRELADRMGLTCASLYNAFGDKRALFRRALETYLAESRERMAVLERTLAPKVAIARYLEGAIDRSLADRERRGCMMVNCTLEFAPDDDEVRDLVCRQLDTMETFFRRCIQAGQRDGSIADEVPAEELARHLLGTLMGLRVLARARPDRKLLEGVVRPALSLLDRS
ncbi:MAG TPA: helix-turn-helix domain-containing protein [Acetobacteraceae bacterium]